jgi:hypothetical protein
MAETLLRRLERDRAQQADHLREVLVVHPEMHVVALGEAESEGDLDAARVDVVVGHVDRTAGDAGCIAHA